ncbi:hypothetical protein [Streptomyces sp. NPDC050856]|uniref:hypothetical protein n=1 Tax=unclassified Streptomyces TaxID=2593676 RepID=UPI0033CE05E2
MSLRTTTRLIAVCAGAAGAAVSAVSPALADGGPAPAAAQSPIVTSLNSGGAAGPLGSQGPQSPGQASPLPVGGALLGGLPASGLPLGG